MEPMLPMPSQSESKPHPSTQEGRLPIDAQEYQGGPAPVQERLGGLQPLSSPVTQLPQAISSTQGAPSIQATPINQPLAAVPAPLVADDVDVIEKEWVDKAKRIISSTKEDPHHQERQVSALQADYLMKRYNKKIKLAE